MRKAVVHKKTRTAKQYCNSSVYQHVTQIQTKYKEVMFTTNKIKESVLLGVLEWY